MEPVSAGCRAGGRAGRLAGGGGGAPAGGEGSGLLGRGQGQGGQVFLGDRPLTWSPAGGISLMSTGPCSSEPLQAWAGTSPLCSLLQWGDPLCHGDREAPLQGAPAPQDDPRDQAGPRLPAAHLARYATRSPPGQPFSPLPPSTAAARPPPCLGGASPCPRGPFWGQMLPLSPQAACVQLQSWSPCSHGVGGAQAVAAQCQAPPPPHAFPGPGRMCAHSQQYFAEHSGAQPLL